MNRPAGRSLAFFLAILPALLGLFSCQEKTYDPDARVFLAHFEGKIGKKERLSMDILCIGKELTGYAVRAGAGKPLPLRGRVDGMEFSLEGVDARDGGGRFAGTAAEDGSGLKGEWTDAEGSVKLPFRLELEKKKALLFASAMDREGDPKAYEAVVALAEPLNATKDFLKRFRSAYLGGLPLDKGIEAAGADSRARILAAVGQGAGGYRRFLSAYRNYGGILSMFEVEETRLGPSLETRRRLRSYDYAKDRVLGLADILKPGMASALDQALTATIKLMYSLGPAGSLSKLGFKADAVRATDSFGLAEGGILFFFAAGEIADKGLGDLSVYLPSDLLGDFVKPGTFKK